MSGRVVDSSVSVPPMLTSILFVSCQSFHPTAAAIAAVATLAAIRAGRPDDAGRLARQHAMDTGTALDQKG